MQVDFELQLKAARKKVSGQGNIYYELDFIETLPVKDEQGSYMEREWNKVFYKPENPEENIQVFVSKNVKTTLNFYSVSRKVGEKMYTDVKMNVVCLENALKN